MIIEIEGFQVELTRKPVKYINLRITSQGSIKVSAPKRSSLTNISKFVKDKSSWIKSHQERLKDQEILLNMHARADENHFFLGDRYKLIIKESDIKKGITLNKSFMHCFAPANASLHETQAILHHWYRKQMETLLPALIKKWEPIIGVRVLEYGIKTMKTRWGSCNTVAKRIWINLHLIQKPLICLEYVLVHEMVHLLEPSHNKRFHSLMTKFMPKWPEYRLLLNTKLV
ncbi:zinc metalloprotease [Legionella beliardensis]|uniref:Zinc metalloprotease n=1 Tax=Legionella beliardensis TaxID=91822 RepID=A0A378HYQ4_9GAMM|nr:SprT family zinc-dependent metalloprotease [Legionella beliardensis]STX27843.1 zinc metalloprotease [Legionella beliardensis]